MKLIRRKYISISEVISLSYTATEKVITKIKNKNSVILKMFSLAPTLLEGENLIIGLYDNEITSLIDIYFLRISFTPSEPF